MWTTTPVPTPSDKPIPTTTPSPEPTETPRFSVSLPGGLIVFTGYAAGASLDSLETLANLFAIDAPNTLDFILATTGELVVFAYDRDTGTFQLYLMNVDGSELQLLTSGEGNNIEPSWSADGNMEQLTFDPASDRLPAFSPSGDSIAFVSKRDGNPDVYIMVADGRDQINVTFDPGVDTEPAWSEEGDWIVFSTNRDCNFELYLLSVAHVTLHRLTDTPVFDERMPYWHP